jgi:hypothetical protein
MGFHARQEAVGGLALSLDQTRRGPRIETKPTPQFVFRASRLPITPLNQAAVHRCVRGRSRPPAQSFLLVPARGELIPVAR